MDSLSDWCGNAREIAIGEATIEAQLKAPHPSRAVVKAAGGFVLGILTGVAANAAFELVKHAPEVLR